MTLEQIRARRGLVVSRWIWKFKYHQKQAFFETIWQFFTDIWQLWREINNKYNVNQFKSISAVIGDDLKKNSDVFHFENLK